MSCLLGLWGSFWWRVVVEWRKFSSAFRLGLASTVILSNVIMEGLLLVSQIERELQSCGRISTWYCCVELASASLIVFYRNFEENLKDEADHSSCIRELWPKMGQRELGKNVLSSLKRRIEDGRAFRQAVKLGNTSWFRDRSQSLTSISI
jgi:hypothetical protein